MTARDHFAQAAPKQSQNLTPAAHGICSTFSHVQKWLNYLTGGLAHSVVLLIFWTYVCLWMVYSSLYRLREFINVKQTKWQDNAPKYCSWKLWKRKQAIWQCYRVCLHENFAKINHTDIGKLENYRLVVIISLSQDREKYCGICSINWIIFK